MLRPLLAALALAATPVFAADPPVAQLPAISVVTVAETPLRDIVRASGTIGPVERVFVQPQIEGQAIETLEADVGDVVEEGEVLARLSSTTLELEKNQLQAQRASAEASIAQARASLIEAEASRDEAVRVRERTATLRAQGSASQAALDQADASATAAEARVAVAVQVLAAAEAQRNLVDAQIANIELNLRRTELTAPVSGEIVERAARIGAIASASAEPMFVIVRDGSFELGAEVPEADILRLAPGQEALVRPIGSTAPIAGRIRRIEPVIDATTRLGIARITLEDGARILSGLFAEAAITVVERTALAVPLTSISTNGGNGSAFVLRVGEDGTVERAEVQTGIRDGSLIEIVSGLAAGDTVVLRVGGFVRAGDRVNPVPAEAVAEASN